MQYNPDDYEEEDQKPFRIRPNKKGLMARAGEPAPLEEEEEKLKETEGGGSAGNGWGGWGGFSRSPAAGGTPPAGGTAAKLKGKMPPPAAGTSTGPAEAGEGQITNYDYLSNMAEKPTRMSLTRERMNLDPSDPADRARMKEIDDQLDQLQSPRYKQL